MNNSLHILRAELEGARESYNLSKEVLLARIQKGEDARSQLQTQEWAIEQMERAVTILEETEGAASSFEKVARSTQE